MDVTIRVKPEEDEDFTNLLNMLCQGWNVVYKDSEEIDEGATTYMYEVTR